MIRKFNYTGRQKIKRSSIKIDVFESDQLRTFNADVNLIGLNLPSESTIYIEPYYRLSFMRFDCGTVGDFHLPPDTSITEIPYSDILYFRVKVVDESGKHGRLLAYADNIKPTNLDNGPIKRRSILPVQFSTDLGQQIWKVSFDEHGPILHINKKIENRKELVRSDEFMSLSLPAVIKEILTRIVYQYPEFDEDGEHWVSDWLEFSKKILYVHDKPSSNNDNFEEMIEWIDSVIEAFCRKFTIRNRYEQSRLIK